MPPPFLFKVSDRNWGMRFKMSMFGPLSTNFRIPHPVIPQTTDRQNFVLGYFVRLV